MMARTLTTVAAVLACAASVMALPPSTRPGVGAIPYSSGGQYGTTFRVFAPFADSVAVGGTFNGWNSTQYPLSNEFNGYWSGDVPFVTAGQRYKFFVKRGTTSGWKNDPRARDLTSSVGDSVIYNPASYTWQHQFTMPQWRKLVMYEMHPGAFFAPTAGVPGNFANVRSKLQHLEDLGVNAIALMPINEFPGDYSWGYNPSYPYSVESAYGSPNDLKAFIDEAHSRGIAVMGDVVFNHLGPNDMDLWRFDHWYSGTGGGSYFFNDFRLNTPWGNTRPDYTRGEVRTYIKDNCMMWLEEFRMDGLRMDGTKYIRRTDQNGVDIPEGWSLLQWINDAVDASQPWKFMIAEDMDLNPWLGKTTGEGGAGFDSQWDPGFFPNIRGNLITPNDADRNMFAVKDAILYGYNGQIEQRIIYTESHDEVANGKQRVPSEIWSSNPGSWFSRKRSMLGGAIVMTSPGIPMLFQGQEFLEDGWFQDTDPLDWSKTATYAGTLRHYTDLIKLRKNDYGCTEGLSGQNTNVFHVNNFNKVLGMHRWQNGGAGDDVVVVFNFSTNPISNYRIGLPRNGLWRCIFNGDWTGYGSDYANHPCFDTEGNGVAWDGLGQSGLISLGAYSCAVFTQGPCAYPPPPGDPADLDGSGTVDGGDLGILLGNWGGTGIGDIDGSGAVDGADLGMLLSAWGS